MHQKHHNLFDGRVWWLLLYFTRVSFCLGCWNEKKYFSFILILLKYLLLAVNIDFCRKTLQKSQIRGSTCVPKFEDTRATRKYLEKGTFVYLKWVWHQWFQYYYLYLCHKIVPSNCAYVFLFSLSSGRYNRLYYISEQRIWPYCRSRATSTPKSCCGHNWFVVNGLWRSNIMFIS